MAFDPDSPYALVNGAAGPAVYLQDGVYYEADGSVVSAPSDNAPQPVYAQTNDVTGGINKIDAVTVAELPTRTGEIGTLYVLSDGPDAGAKLAWGTPEGASAPTWCWWLWPQSAYEY